MQSSRDSVSESESPPAMIEIELITGDCTLLAREAGTEEAARHSEQLAGWYTDRHNREMMDGQPMTAREVLDCLNEAREAGCRWFLLFRNGELVGDADFRAIQPPVAEFAIMIGPASAQGQGLGKTFSTMLHQFAFEKLELETVFLTVLARNIAGQRCYRGIGYLEDRSPEAASRMEGADDIPMSLGREQFFAARTVQSRSATIRELTEPKR